MTEDRSSVEYLEPTEEEQGDFDIQRPVREYSIGEDGMLVDETPAGKAAPVPAAKEEPEPEQEPEPEPEEETTSADEVQEGGDVRVAELEHQLAAARADFYNYRQRVLRERQEQRKKAVDDTIASLLPVLDNLDRALSVPGDGSAKDVLMGVDMVRRQFIAALDELGVTLIPAAGERFDPTLHEAVSIIPVDNPEWDGAVVEEQLRGYRSGDRVLRPARVTVGKVQ